MHPALHHHHHFNLSEKHQISSKSLTVQTGQPGIETIMHLQLPFLGNERVQSAPAKRNQWRAAGASGTPRLCGLSLPLLQHLIG